VADTTISFDFDAYESSPEQALIEGLRQGVEEAYESLIRNFQQPVYSLVVRLLADPAEANDVVQEVFLKVFRNIRSFRGNSSLKTWIYRISVNEAHNYRRWFSRHKKHEVRLEGEEGNGRGYQDVLPDPGHSPFEVALTQETHLLIEEALAGLKPVFRTAVVLRDVEDMDYEEIAEVLQVSLGTVKSRILRGREALRRRLASRLEQGRAFGLSPQPAEQE